MLFITELFIILIIFFIFNKYNILIGTKFSLIDKNKNVPLLGGIFLLIALVLNLFHLYQYNMLSSNHLIIFYFLISMFFISILDDKFNLSPLLRLFLCTFIIVIFFIQSGFIIKTLNFKYFGIFFFPENIFITYFFSIFCIIVLIHAYNFVDGINGLALFVGSVWFLYIAFKLPYIIETYSILFLFILFSLYLNLTNKIFLGDSGNYIISSLLGVIIIKENLSDPSLFYVEEILLLFLIPGVDLIRLFFLRIKEKRNPLNGDFNHLHHLLIRRYSLFKSLLIYILLISIPLIVFIFNEEFLIYLITLKIFIYFILIKHLKKF